MKKKFTWLVLLAVLSSSLPLMAQNFAVSLDGATNSVTTTAQIVPAGADFTVEFWAYVPSIDGANHEFVSQGTVGSGAFYIGYDATGQIRVGDAWTATGVQVPVGAWFHLALTYFNATTTATLYINDIIRNSNAAYSFTGGGQPFAMGQQTDGTELLLGEMDELKVWSVARAQASIKNGMFHGTNPSDPAFPNVIAYYQMNEGSGSTLTNISNTSGLNGTINGTISGSTWASSPIQYAINAMSFDGTGDTKIVVPPSGIWDALSSATIELNVNLGTNIATKGDVLSIHAGASTKLSILLFSTGIQMFNGAGGFDGVGDASLTPGTWHHLSFVTDGVMDTTGVYDDGVYLGKMAVGYDPGATGLPLNMGVTTAGTDNENYDGGLDEVRIWNTMLTQAQINTMMSEGLTGTEPNLVALYNFDYGIASGDNSFLTTAFDATSNNNHGTLTGFAMTGSTSNLIAGSGITPLPVIFNTFTAVAEGKEALLKWQTAQEENSRDFTIERSADGSPNSFTAIGTVPAAGNSSTKLSYSFNDVSPLIGLNYYQLRETDLDGHIMYSPLRSLKFAFSGSELAWHKNGNGGVEVDLYGGNSDNYIVTDMLGRTIQQGQMSYGKMYLNQVPAGIYVVKIVSATGAQYSTKVLVD